MIRNSLNPRVEICGGIASGKTSLAMLLSKRGFQAGLENFSSNPFFSDFYADPSGYAFETEITFLLQHFSAIRTTPHQNKIRAFDFSLALDLAYAQVTLSAEDQAVFNVVHRASVKKLGTPDLLVRLRCDIDEELSRIRKRGREQEQGVKLSYLEQIESALDRAIASEPFSQTPILEIDSRRINFVTDSVGIALVCQEIKERLGALGHQVLFEQKQHANLRNGLGLDSP